MAHQRFCRGEVINNLTHRKTLCNIRHLVHDLLSKGQSVNGMQLVVDLDSPGGLGDLWETFGRCSEIMYRKMTRNQAHSSSFHSSIITSGFSSLHAMKPSFTVMGRMPLTVQLMPMPSPSSPGNPVSGSTYLTMVRVTEVAFFNARIADGLFAPM